MVKQDLDQVPCAEAMIPAYAEVLAAGGVHTVGKFLKLEGHEIRRLGHELGFIGIERELLRLQQIVIGVYGIAIGLHEDLPIIQQIWPGNTRLHNVFMRLSIPLPFAATASIEELLELPRVGFVTAIQIFFRQGELKEALNIK